MAVQIRDVPRERVGQVVDEFLADPDVKEVSVKQQADGLWTVEKKDTDDQGPG